jgi:hypothetical protein
VAGSGWDLVSMTRENDGANSKCIRMQGKPETPYNEKDKEGSRVR